MIPRHWLVPPAARRLARRADGTGAIEYLLCLAFVVLPLAALVPALLRLLAAAMARIAVAVGHPLA